MGWQTNYPGVLSAPMSWGDISSALGVGGPPYTMGDMVTNGVINKWSKVKPFQPVAASDTVAWASAAERDAAAAAVNFGLTPQYLSYANMRTNYASSGWTYNRPTTWFRAGLYQDLDGYINNADTWQLSASTNKVLYAPFGLVLTCPDTTIGNSDVISLDMYKENIGFLVDLSDFSNLTYDLKNWYVGVLFIADSTHYALYNTGLKPPTEDYIHAEIPINNNLDNNYTYTLIPVLIQSPTNTSAGYTGTNGLLCSFDAKYLSGIKKIASSGNVFVTNTITSIDNSGVHGSVNIINNAGARISVNDLFMYLEAAYLVDWDATNHALVEAAAEGWVGSSHTRLTGGVKDASNNIIGRYLNLSNSSFYIANGSSQTLTYTVPYLQDELGNLYDPWAVAYTQIGYTPDGSTQQYRTY